MSNSLLEFLRSNPFWAVFIIIFMILPIVGAVIHILLKAFGRRGLDNTSTLPEEPPEETLEDRGDGGSHHEDEKKPPEPKEKP